MFSLVTQIALGAALLTGVRGKPVAYRYVLDTNQTKPTSTRVRTMLEVQNSAFNDAVVYAVQGLRVVRLGNVTGLTTQKLTVPDYLLFGASRIRFAVHPIGGRGSQVSDEITIYQGDTVSLFIPPF